MCGSSDEDVVAQMEIWYLSGVVVVHYGDVVAYGVVVAQMEMW